MSCCFAPASECPDRLPVEVCAHKGRLSGKSHSRHVHSLLAVTMQYWHEDRSKNWWNEVEELNALYRGGGYGGRGYGYGSPFRTFINISDLFFYWDPYYSRRQKALSRETPAGPNFFEAIFSYGGSRHIVLVDVRMSKSGVLLAHIYILAHT